MVSVATCISVGAWRAFNFRNFRGERRDAVTGSPLVLECNHLFSLFDLSACVAPFISVVTLRYAAPQRRTHHEIEWFFATTLVRMRDTINRLLWVRLSFWGIPQTLEVRFDDTKGFELQFRASEFEAQATCRYIRTNTRSAASTTNSRAPKRTNAQCSMRQITSTFSPKYSAASVLAFSFITLPPVSAIGSVTPFVDAVDAAKPTSST